MSIARIRFAVDSATVKALKADDPIAALTELEYQLVQKLTAVRMILVEKSREAGIVEQYVDQFSV